MKKEAYKRKPGDFEIRILKSGKVVMIAPDAGLVEVAQVIAPNNSAVRSNTEAKDNARCQEGETK
jgi:hypothetical protein